MIRRYIQGDSLSVQHSLSQKVLINVFDIMSVVHLINHPVHNFFYHLKLHNLS